MDKSGTVHRLWWPWQLALLFQVELALELGMYESSCSYQSALDLKRVSAACPPAVPAIKSEDCMSAGLSGTAGDWAAGCAYRFACNSSTFEQLKQSVEKAKAALQDRGSYLAASSAFSDLASSPFAPPPRSNAVTQDPLQDARRDDAITSISEKRTHSECRHVSINIGNNMFILLVLEPSRSLSSSNLCILWKTTSRHLQHYCQLSCFWAYRDLNSSDFSAMG